MGLTLDTYSNRERPAIILLKLLNDLDMSAMFLANRLLCFFKKKKWSKILG